MGNEAVDILAERLGALERESPALAKAAGLYRVLLPLIEDADARAAPAALSRDEVRRLIKGGVPILRGAPPVFDVKAAGDLLSRLARALEGQGVPGASAIREAAERDLLDMAVLLSGAASGDEAPAGAAARSLGLNPDLLRTLLRDALKPALRAARRLLAPLLPDGFRWDRGDCFVCGTAAAFGELQGNDQSLHLRCGLCGADWPHPRMQCASCGNVDADTLGLLYPEPGRDKARVALCERCRGYIKLIVTFEPTPPELLSVEDLATLHLDDAARRHGYARMPPPPSRS